MATALEVPRVGVGVILTRNEGQEILVGRRKGGLEPDVWALPGGHLEHGESFEQCAERELLEETSLRMEHAHYVWACNTIFSSKHHYVTVFVQGTHAGVRPQLLQVDVEPVLTEPDKCYEWRWVSFSDIPQPWFTPLQNLLQSGFEPSADKVSMNVRLSEVVVSESARSSHKTVFEVHSNTKEDEEWGPTMEIAAAVQPTGHGTGSYVGHTVQRGPELTMADDGMTADHGNEPGDIVLMGPVVPPIRTSSQQQSCACAV